MLRHGEGPHHPTRIQATSGKGNAESAYRQGGPLWLSRPWRRATQLRLGSCRLPARPSDASRSICPLAYRVRSADGDRRVHSSVPLPSQSRATTKQLLPQRPQRRCCRMTDERQRHMRKASRLLQSVQKRADSDEPEAVISTAYLAMHHAACAVLLWQGQPLPKTHASLIGQFGLIIRDLGPDGREAGASLHEAFIRRVKGDYDVDASFARSDALAARDRAASFISYCRLLLRKRRP